MARYSRVYKIVIDVPDGGLPFCVLPSRPGSLDDSNAQRWD